MIEYENSTELKCPKCGYNYVYPVAVYIICGNTRHTITGNGYAQETIAGNDSRGVIIVREFRCESEDCRWLEIDEFHKGNVNQETREIEPLIGNTGVIWNT